MPGSIAVPSLFLRHTTQDCQWVSFEFSSVAHKIGYARVSTTDQDPQLQLDALAAEDCLKIYTDTATGTRADRPEWNKCLADLRPGDTLIIWKINRLGRNLRDLIEIVTTLEARGVGVKSLTNGIVDTTTAHGKLVFGIFALGGLHLTGVDWPGGQTSWRRALPQVRGRVSGMVPHRCRLSRLSGVGAVAAGVRVPGVRPQGRLAAWGWPDHVRRLRAPDLRDSGHDL